MAHLFPPKICSTARMSTALITMAGALFFTLLLASPAAAQDADADADNSLPDSDVADPWVDADGGPVCSDGVLPLVEMQIDDPDDTNDPPRKKTVQVRPNRSELCTVRTIPTGYTTMPPGINKPREPLPMVERSVVTFNETTQTWETTRQTVPDVFAINKAWEAYNKEVLARDATRKTHYDYVNPNPPSDYVKPPEPPEKPTPWQSCGDTTDDCNSYDSQYDETPDGDYGTSGGNTAPTSTDTYSTGTDSDGDVTATVTPTTVTRNTDLTAREQANKTCTNNCEKAGDKDVAYPAIFKPDNWLENADEFFEAYDVLDDGGQPFYTCEYMYPVSKPEEFTCYLQTPGS